jgi:hydrogenase expression/formation protein HypD
VFPLRDKQTATQIISSIKKLNRHYTFMHVCGTHQDTLVKHGLDSLLSSCGIHIRQGPGCPVCVTSPKEIEEMLVIAEKNHIVATFGDMIRVPGEKKSLQNMKEQGCDVRTVYSVEDAVEIAKKNKQKDVVFMAVGFETTTPMNAAVIQQDPPENFSLLCCHRLIPPALQAILEMGEIHLDGLLQPGHVSVIIGSKPYEFLSEQYHIPQVIAGFEPLDLLMAAWMLTRQLKKQESLVENEYTRVVDQDGNTKAKALIDSVFEECDVKWRGFPVIPKSGLKIKRKYEQYDARKKYEDELRSVYEKEFTEPKNCRCGDVLRGVISSEQCPLFGNTCQPTTPVGPCMVSTEGSCNIQYRYQKNK